MWRALGWIFGALLAIYAFGRTIEFFEDNAATIKAALAVFVFLLIGGFVLKIFLSVRTRRPIAQKISTKKLTRPVSVNQSSVGFSENKSPLPTAASGGRVAPRVDAGTLVDNGRKFLDRHDTARAFVELDRALQVDPEHMTALKLRGVAFARIHDYQKAIADFDRVIALNPADVGIYSLRGHAKHLAGDPLGAVVDYDRVLRVYTGDAKVLERRKAAVADASALAAKVGSPSLKDDINAAPATGLPPAPSVPGQNESVDFDKMVEWFTLAIKNNPTDADGYRLRGIAYGHKLQFRDAIDDFDHALSLAPNNVQCFCLRGLAWQAIGDFNKSIADFDAVLELDPGNETARRWRAAAMSARAPLEATKAEAAPTEIITPVEINVHTISLQGILKPRPDKVKVIQKAQSSTPGKY